MAHFAPVAISPNVKMIACCGDQFIQLFDAKSGDRLKRLEGHTGAVNFVAFSPDGKVFASAGEDQTIRLWEVETWKPKGVLKQRIQVSKDPFTCLAFSPDSKLLPVIWKPALCRHSGICFRGLPKVFDPRRRPWVELRHADSATVTAQVERCPSGALSWTRSDEET